MRSTSRAVAAATVTVLLAAALAYAAAPAHATYPGRNGRLAFGVTYGDPNSGDIYTVRPDGRGFRRLTDAPTFDLCATYSRDGRYIAYCSGTNAGPGGASASEIWTMKANGARKRQVTFTGGVAAFPDFSPDGTKILFTGRIPATTTADLYIVNTDGTGLTRLTTDPATDRWAVWSPDGSRIAFNSTRSGVEQIWVMDADGGNPRQLTTDPAPKGQVADWSPDGRKIAYQSATGGGDIWMMNADGTGQTRLTTDPAEDFGPAWSPDGTLIAFASRRGPGGLSTVHIMNADGTDPHAVHPGGSQAVPAWQPRPPWNRVNDPAQTDR